MAHRIQRVNELVKRELGSVLLRNKDLPKGVLVTVTAIECSSSLQDAKAYIAVLPQPKEKEVMDALSRDIYHIQQQMNKRLRMRPVPKLTFVVDSAPEKALRIEQLLSAEEENKKT